MIDTHLTDYALAELLDDIGNNVDYVASRAHLTQCLHCQIALTELKELVRDPGVRNELDRQKELSEAERVPTVARKHVGALMGALAAAAVLLLGVRATVPREQSPDRNMGYGSAMLAPTIGPQRLDTLTQRFHAETLTWTRVPHANRYHVIVFDESGAVAWEHESGDTSITLPHAVAARLTGAIHWRVTTRNSIDGWAESPVVPRLLSGPRAAP